MRTCIIDCSHLSSDDLSWRIIYELGSRTAQLDAEALKADYKAAEALGVEDAEADYSQALYELSEPIVDTLGYVIEDNSVYEVEVCDCGEEIDGPYGSIVGYVFQASIYCPKCAGNIGRTFGGSWTTKSTTEEILDNAARYIGVDRTDETSFDSSEFPKVVLES